jgi:hypothetical protein
MILIFCASLALDFEHESRGMFWLGGQKINEWGDKFVGGLEISADEICKI